MKTMQLLLGAALLAIILYGLEQETRGPPTCRSGEPEGLYEPEPGEVEAHRRMPELVIDYPQGSKPSNTRNWEFGMTLGVDRSGRVICLHYWDSWWDRLFWNHQRRDVVQQLVRTGYLPFTRDGEVVGAMFEEYVREQTLPIQHVDMPSVPLDQIEIELSRGPCEGTCPAYSVTLHGDGRVKYEGYGFVDVSGIREYAIPPARVAELVDSIRDEDIWSMNSVYETEAFDHPTYNLQLQFGTHEKQIRDYDGGRVGMPVAVTHIEDAIDRISGSSDWTRLSMKGIERLASEGFDFEGEDGAKTLVQIIQNNPQPNLDVIRALIDRGVPIDAHVSILRLDQPERAIEAALRRGQLPVAELLIAHGALESDGAPSQEKVDAALKAAIQGGDSAAVNAVRAAAGCEAPPTCRFQDHSSSDARPLR